LWELGGTDHLPAPGATDPPGVRLLRAGVTGQFSADVRVELERCPELVSRIARAVLDAHFPESLHPDILDAVGLDITAAEAIRGPGAGTARTRGRDPRFRDAVLRAYGECCVICGVGMRFAMTSVVIGVEAAHVMWFQAGGPDDVANGLALCSLHHRAFDLGAFTLGPDGRILVSADLCGPGADVTLGQYHAKSIRPPAVDADRPSGEYLGWHREEVFRGRSRS
jgi:putative restriction endonuclease